MGQDTAVGEEVVEGESLDVLLEPRGVGAEELGGVLPAQLTGQLQEQRRPAQANSSPNQREDGHGMGNRRASRRPKAASRASFLSVVVTRWSWKMILLDSTVQSLQSQPCRFPLDRD